MPASETAPAAGQALHVVCLCAAWCRTCDAYADTLQSVVAEFVARGLAHAPRWIDIEDEAELVGDVDIETFPTLLVYDDAALVRLAGPVTPQPETLRRLLASLAAHGAAARGLPGEFTGLAQRLCAESRER